MTKPFLGKLLGALPDSLRFAPYFTEYYAVNTSLRGEALRRFQYQRLQRLIGHAYEKVKFYRWYYDEHGFHPAHFRDLRDLEKVPVVNKKLLAGWDIEERSYPALLRRKSNTGGTYGRPLGFYVDRAAYAREWACMLVGWQRLGYEFSKPKLTLRGVNTENQSIQYKVRGNEFFWNVFAQVDAGRLRELRSLLEKHPIAYLHGYPSAIFQFLREIEALAPGFSREHFRLQGVFLGSEFPVESQRRYIEETVGCRTVSWYGHSEKAVLAVELNERYVYEVMPAYGFAEAIPTANGHSLVATGYDNFASPFIRYDTEDPVSVVESLGPALLSFKMLGGRAGESIVDAAGAQIPITGLMYGRHHRAFEVFESVQFYQPAPGKLEFLIVARDTAVEPANYFDLTGVRLDVSFRFVDAPIRAKNGKVSPLLKSLESL